MKSTIALKCVAFAAATIGTLSTSTTAWAQTQFNTREVDQDRFLTVAAPGSVLIPYSLYVIEQRSDTRSCFEISGSAPGEVNPLWTTFDFTQGNTCGRSSDSNGYSIRVDDEELGTAYRLQVKKSGDELVLLGTPRRGPALLIGRTGGISSTGFTEVKLQPGWRITQRVFEGRSLGHFYFTNDATLAELTSGDEVAVTPPTTLPPVTTPPEPVPFPDVRGDIYATEISRAVDIGFIAGFQDGTFKPTRPVTREEAASMVVEALQAYLPAGEQLPLPQVTTNPFPDVAANRWSAQKIALLRQYEVVAGDPDGSYRPTATITRAELMAMLRKAAIAYRAELNLTAELEPTQDIFAFSDISSHWAQGVITMMSGYCGVASPLNERGNAFQPNANALRNYTAAAIDRLFDCGSTPDV